MRIASPIVVSVFFSAFCSSTIFARSVPSWDIDELFRKADVVLVVAHIGTRDAATGEAKAPFDAPHHERMLTPVRSTLKTLVVLKGEYVEKELLLNHHRFDWEKWGQQGIRNGPNLIVFEDTSQKPHQPCYMIFLRRHSNGMLLPVTGMFDPRFSIKQLVDPEMDWYGKYSK